MKLAGSESERARVGRCHREVKRLLFVLLAWIGGEMGCPIACPEAQPKGLVSFARHGRGHPGPDVHMSQTLLVQFLLFPYDRNPPSFLRRTRFTFSNLQLLPAATIFQACRPLRSILAGSRKSATPLSPPRFWLCRHCRAHLPVVVRT